MDAKYQDLVDVLCDTRKLLALPDNDFTWSRWKDASEALAEIDGFISCIENGKPLKQPEFSLLFMPTASLQEVSLSSGWGFAFLKLADRFDAAVEKAFKADPPPPPASFKRPRHPRP